MASSPRYFFTSCLDQSGTDYREQISGIFAYLYIAVLSILKSQFVIFMLAFCGVVTSGVEFLRFQILP